MRINWTILYYMIVLIILLIIGLVTARISSQKIKETQQLIDSIAIIETNLDAMESGVLRGVDTGLRGYIISQNEEMLDPYSYAFVYFDELADESESQLRTLGYDLTPIDSLRVIIGDYLNYGRGVKLIFDSLGYESAQAEIAKDKGLQTWHDYNTYRIRLKNQLTDHKESINADVDLLQRNILIIQTVCFLISLLVITMVYRKIVRFARTQAEYVRRVKDINEELEEHKAHLEDEVIEKTKELKDSNDELKSKVEQLEKIQAQMIQSEKMASLGTLTSGIAHEFNNSLNYIKGGYQVAKKSILGEKQLPIEEEKMISKAIEQGVDRISRIVDSLHVFSDHDSKQFEECDINQLIQNLVFIKKNNKNQKIRFFTNLRLKDTLWVNKSSMQLMFLQLLDNAIDAVSEQEVNDPLVMVETFVEGSSVQISVSNNGPQIPSEILGSIFDPFYTTKDPGRGTGLGLSMCYSIAEDHGGRIFVDNMPGKVSFIIELPTKSIFKKVSQD